MTAIGWPSQKSCSARACRGVRIAEARSVACSKSARVACHVGEGALAKTADVREPLDAR